MDGQNHQGTKQAEDSGNTDSDSKASNVAASIQKTASNNEGMTKTVYHRNRLILFMSSMKISSTEMPY